MYDPEQIKAVKDAIDLRDLVGTETELRPINTLESEGVCSLPGCTSDHDGLHVKRGGWLCHTCRPPAPGKEWGDLFEYLERRYGLPFDGAMAWALDYLGWEKAEPATNGPRMAGTSANRQKSPLFKATAAPGDKWQQSARLFVDMAARILWETPAALAYLVDRGLSEATIKAAHLGYWPRNDWRPGDRWGQDGKVWLPRGWVIPCEVGDALQYVKVRRPTEDIEAAKAWNAAHPEAKNKRPEGKYIAIKGGPVAGAVYGLDDLAGKADGVLVEGELNALILKQAVGDVCGVASLGDAGNTPGAQALPVLARVKRLWLAYDPDKAGQDGAAKMAGLSARARVLAWPWADRGEKYDVADAYKDGENLAAWVFGQIGPITAVARARWFEHQLRLFLADPTIEPGDPAYTIGRNLLNAFELLTLDAEALAELAADDIEVCMPWEYDESRAIWHGSDGSETAVQVLAHLGGGFCRVRSLLDGREYDVQADRLQMETATTAPRTGATGRKRTKKDKPENLEAPTGDMLPLFGQRGAAA